MLLRRPAGDVGVHRRGTATTTRTADCRLWRQRRPGQMGPRPGRGRAGGAAPRSRFRRNPKGAWVLRAIAALLLLDDPRRDRLRRRALRSPHFHSPNWKFARSGTLRVNTHARDPLYFHHGLLRAGAAGCAVPRSGRDRAATWRSTGGTASPRRPLPE